MKQLFVAIFLLLAGVFNLQAQILEPAQWNFEKSSQDVKVGETIDLVFTATIDPKWYLYSSDFDPDLGPKVTTFVFDENESFELVGEVVPVNPEEKYDEIFEGDVTFFKGTGEFRQTIKVLQPTVSISGLIDYQVCSDIDGRCIPFEQDFIFNFKARQKTKAKEEVTTNEEANKIEKKQESDDEKFINDNSEPEEDTAASADTKPLVPDEDEEEVLNEDESGIGTKFLRKNSEDNLSIIAFMIFAFIGGIGAVMTPCVYPMIPMTVAFFSKNSENKLKSRIQAFFYGFSIIFIFTFIGIAITLIFGPQVWNEIATNAIANIIFFLIFFVFALSFFGLFDITLPSGFVNKIDKQADKGGTIGTFFMALTLVVVSFSCTAPIAGTILMQSTQGSLIKPALGMFAFSLAFAIPFTLFSIFPQWINNLPKSGGWLNSVKVVLGFIELALGLKFLSVADNVYHWGFLDRDVYLVLWIVIFSLMGFYLLGKIKLPHDSELKNISVFRLILAIITFSFVVYLIPGLVGAPLKPLAGYMPPIYTQDFNLYKTAVENNTCSEPKYDEFLDFAYPVSGYFDYEQALDCAKEQNKPLFVDFTGHGCVNCRAMEVNVLSDPKVLEILNEDYVVVALYVDERRELPEEDWIVSQYDGKVKKTIGKQNIDFQMYRYNANAQPYYVLLDNQERVLNDPIAYDLDVANFIQWLQAGLAEFEDHQDNAVANN